MPVAVRAEDIITNTPDLSERQRRGINVYSYAELQAIGGRDENDNYYTVPVQQPLFTLSLDERMEVFRFCAPIFGVVTSRMNRLAGLKWQIVPDRKNEDRIVEEMRMYYDLWREYSDTTSVKHIIIRMEMQQEMYRQLPELLPDLSNFESALLRWSRKIKLEKTQSADEIEDWLQKPNINDKYEDFIKKWVCDLHVHGTANIYKEDVSGRVENLYLLPGGTVLPIRHKYVGGAGAYVQYITGMEPQIFYNDEIVHSTYVPVSSRSYGAVPIECLVNKVAESLLFDRLMAEQSDGTRPPQKVVVFGSNNPFAAGLGGPDEKLDLPLDVNEQERIERSLNEVKKYAIRTLSGVGQPIVLDLSRENTMQIQMERQRQIREEIALVYNMSNMEVNMTGSEDTSGRSTSEAQGEIELGKGIMPLAKKWESVISNEIIPFRFGPGFKLRIEYRQNELEEIAKYKAMKDSGLYAINEIRTQKMNEKPFAGEQFDVPAGAPSPDGSAASPFNFAGI